MNGDGENFRTRIELGQGWDFVQRRMGRRWLDGTAAAADTTAVDLPHCWNAEDTFQPGVAYYRGPGSYRGRFVLPAAVAADDRVWRLESEGFYGVGEVWLNGRRLAAVDGQYLGFSLDVSGRLRPGAENTVGVRLTNRCPASVLPGIRMPDFVLHGGLAGRVSLLGLPSLHLDLLRVEAGCADAMAPCPEVVVRSVVVNDGRRARRCRLRWTLRSADGAMAAGAETGETAIECGATRSEAAVLRVDAPRLWSPDSPALYRLRGEILEGGAAVDAVELSIGLRQAEFRPDRGFFLNGERIELRGVNRHESCPGFGSAMPPGLHREDARLIKSMGLNFVRLSHYPQSPAFLDACDEEGLLVYAEIATWKSVRGWGRWLQNAGRQMRDMIRRDRHHPSVILWGMGNESRSRRAFARLREIALREDSSRPVTYAENHLYRARRSRTIGMPDVWGANYELDQLEAGRDASRLRCVVVSECSNEPHTQRGSLAGELRQAATIEADLARIAGRPYVAGFALWCFNDYATLRKERYLRCCGVVDAWRLPKLSAALLQARYADRPFVRVFCDWGCAGGRTGREVHIVSNCESVRVCRNGVEVAAPAGGVHRMCAVAFEPGVLRAEGLRTGAGGREEMVCDEVHSFGPARCLAVRVEEAAGHARGGDLVAFGLEVTDADGHRVRDWAGEVSVRVTGDGQLRAFAPRGIVRVGGGLGRGFFSAGRRGGRVRMDVTHAALAGGFAEWQPEQAEECRAKT